MLPFGLGRCPGHAAELVQRVDPVPVGVDLDLDPLPPLRQAVGGFLQLGLGQLHAPAAVQQVHRLVVEPARQVALHAAALR